MYPFVSYTEFRSSSTFTDTKYTLTFTDTKYNLTNKLNYSIFFMNYYQY